MIRLFKNKRSAVIINFRVDPRDFMHRSVVLPEETIKALNKAASILQEMSDGQYEIMLVRGCINWGYWRKIRGAIAKIFFCFLHYNDRSAAKLLFSSNGHDDGLSVDILPYDVLLKKTVKFLSLKNVMIRSNEAECLLKINSDLIKIIDRSMIAAGFIGHPDPRERLQMHYRLVDQDLR